MEGVVATGAGWLAVGGCCWTVICCGGSRLGMYMKSAHPVPVTPAPVSGPSGLSKKLTVVNL